MSEAKLELIKLEVQKLELKKGDALAIRVPNGFTEEMGQLAKQVARLVREETGATAFVIVQSIKLTVIHREPEEK